MSLLSRAVAYLRDLPRRAREPLRCPICGEPERDRDSWLLHLGTTHPVWADAMRGALHPEALYRWIEGDGDGAPREGVTVEERRAWLHRVARGLYAFDRRGYPR